MENRLDEKMLNKRFINLNKGVIGVTTIPLVVCSLISIAIKNKASAVYSCTALAGVVLSLIGIMIARHNKYNKCRKILEDGMKIEFLSAQEKVNKNSKIIACTGAIGNSVYEFESEAYPLDAKLSLLDTEIYVDPNNIHNFYIYIPERQ